MKALLVIAILCPCVAFGQQWGTITFFDRNIPIAAGGQTGGGNGNGTYHVPLWAGGSPNVGAGSLPGVVTVGLYSTNGVLLASTIMRTSTATQFFGGTQDVAIPGVLPGETTTLIVRAWQGPDFFTAKNSNYQYRWGEWIFTTKPLGGTAPSGGAKIPTPGMTGWGTEDGAGYVLGPYYLQTGITAPTNGAVLAAPATLNISVHWFIEGFITMTNFSVFANGILLKSLTPTGDGTDGGYPLTTLITAGPFGAGDYTLTTILKGPADLVAASTPVKISVVEPVAVSIAVGKAQNGTFVFDYSANPGLKYSIESSTDLANWQALVTNAPTTNPAQFLDGSPAGERRFYRVNRLANP